MVRVEVRYGVDESEGVGECISPSGHYVMRAVSSSHHDVDLVDMIREIKTR